MKLKSFIFCIACLLFCISPLKSQTLSIFSDSDFLPIPKVKVICKSVKNEVIFFTDSLGKLKLETYYHLNKSFKIVVSCSGYEEFHDSIFSSMDKIIYLKPDNLILSEVVVTAQYTANTADKAVHKVKIIDSQKIQAMAAQNLRDVLTNELNIRLSQDNVLGSGMSLQGISGQNVKILIDGVPVTGRLNGNIDISQINMNNVERIEIIEGPLSVNYGTDALGGTINIITKKMQKESVSVNSNSYYESNGQYNTSGKIGFLKGKNKFSFSGGRNFFDGWRTEDKNFHVEEVRIADSLRYKNWKAKEQLFGTYLMSRDLKKIKLNFTSDYFSELVINKGLPRLPYYETAFDDYYKTLRLTNSLNASGKIKEKFNVNFIFAQTHFQRIKNTYFNDLTSLNQVLTTNAGEQDTSIFNNLLARGNIISTKDSSKFNYELGYDLNQETAMGLRILDQRQAIGDYAFFSSFEYKPSANLIFRPGLRLIYNTQYSAPLVPSLNVKYALKKHPNLTFRFSYARGFRSPSLKELYFYFVDINHNIKGNENLQAENSHNFNLSAGFSKRKSNKTWKADLSMFYNKIENMITLALESGTEYRYFNIEQYQSFGLQLQNELSIKKLKISVGGSYLGIYNQLYGATQTQKYTYSPEGKCNLFYEWTKQNMTFAFFYKYTGKLPGFALDSEQQVIKTQMQDYHTADVSISRSFFKKSFAFSLGAKNLFNVKNIQGVSNGLAHSAGTNSISVGMGRTYFFKLDIYLKSKK